MPVPPDHPGGGQLPGMGELVKKMPGRAHWSAGSRHNVTNLRNHSIFTAPQGVCLSPDARFPEATHPIRTHRTSKSVIANQRARWCGNPFPRKPLILRAPPGAQYRAHDRPHGRCNAAHCLGRDCHIAALPAIIMCFHTTVNERRRLSSARRSRRISCTRASVSEPFCARSFAARSG